LQVRKEISLIAAAVPLDPNWPALIKPGAVRGALVVGVGSCSLFATAVFAQKTAAPSEAEVERVIVTGSMIPTAEEVGPNPVFIINRDLINKSGAGTTTEQLLQRQPVIGGANIPVTNNGTGGAGPAGTAAVSLRGLDPGATLVLLDGRRIAPFPGSANSGYGFVDLTTIPITAVQSIEILKDGASTTYGVDAVAGVVNFKLYKDYRGAQVTIQYGDTTRHDDVAEYRGDVLFGVGDDKTSITGDIFYYKHHDMFSHDRGNSLVPPFLSGFAVPWNLQIQTAAAMHPFDVFGNPEAPAPTPFTTERFFITPPDFANGLTPASDYIPGPTATRKPRGFRGNLSGFNFNLYAGSYPEQERSGGYAAFEHKICDDQLRIFGDFFYVDGKTHDELAPTAAGPFELPGRLPIFVPPNHAFPGGVPPYGGPTPAEVGMSPDAYNPFNPFEQIISGNSTARVFDFGNRLIDNENVAERFTVGVRGDKLFNGTWGYDGAFMYSQIEQISKFQGINLPRFEQILNATEPIFDPTSSSFIGQTVPYNPFGDAQHVVFPSNLPLIDFARLHTSDLFTSKLATLDLNIYTTDLFGLPAGGVGLAFGGVFSRESYRIDPDDQNRLGENADTSAFPAVKAGRKSWAIYAETLVPIFSPKWHIAFFHSLELTAGIRYEEWLNNDTNAAVPKVGVRWQPFDESLTLRSTWGEGFLEPSMVQLYGPGRSPLGPGHFKGFAPTAQFGPPNSPTNPIQDFPNPETSIQQFPNKNVRPEHDRTWTGGIVYTPKWIPPKWGELTLTVDFWDVERSGLAAYLSPSLIINGYNAGIFPAVVSPAQPTATEPAALFDPEGNFAGVSIPYTNGARTRTNGVDLGLQYQIETSVGTFSLLSRWSYLNEMVVNFPGARPRQIAGSSSSEWYAGSFFGDVTNPQAWLKWRGDTTLDWTWHNWDVNTTVHTFDGYWEQIYAKQFDGFWKRHWVHPTWFTDAQISYSLIFTPPVEAAPVPGYSKGSKEVAGKEKEAPPVPYTMPCWKTVLNNTTLTFGVTNILDEDPPHSFGFELGNAIGYPGSFYDNIGRFWYMRMIKKF
jgi:iron complex outermembrane receptor protein